MDTTELYLTIIYNAFMFNGNYTLKMEGERELQMEKTEWAELSLVGLEGSLFIEPMNFIWLILLHAVDLGA